MAKQYLANMEMNLSLMKDMIRKGLSPAERMAIEGSVKAYRQAPPGATSVSGFVIVAPAKSDLDKEIESEARRIRDLEDEWLHSKNTWWEE